MGNFGLGSSGAFLKASEHMQTSARNLQHATKDREPHIQLFKIPSLKTHTIQEKQILSIGQDFKNESEQNSCSTQKLIRRMKEQKTTTVAQSLRIL